jgi:phosphoenolpyruvate phosphomutase
MNKTIVYVGMSADLIHHGHINIIREASKYGSVMIGLLSDDAIETYKRKPIVNFEDRMKMVNGLKHVDMVVEQDTLDYTKNLKQYKPKYVVHGDDWKIGVQQKTRELVINTLKEWGGELIEIPYTDNISTTSIIDSIKCLTKPKQENKYKNIDDEVTNGC